MVNKAKRVTVSIRWVVFERSEEDNIFCLERALPKDHYDLCFLNHTRLGQNWTPRAPSSAYCKVPTMLCVCM